jgi:hypothetical protein
MRPGVAGHLPLMQESTFIRRDSEGGHCRRSKRCQIRNDRNWSNTNFTHAATRATSLSQLSHARKRHLDLAQIPDSASEVCTHSVLSRPRGVFQNVPLHGPALRGGTQDRAGGLAISSPSSFNSVWCLTSSRDGSPSLIAISLRYRATFSLRTERCRAIPTPVCKLSALRGRISSSIRRRIGAVIVRQRNAR